MNLLQIVAVNKKKKKKNMGKKAMSNLVRNLSQIVKKDTENYLKRQTREKLDL